MSSSMDRFEIDPARAAAILDQRTSGLAARIEDARGERIDVLKFGAGGECFALPLTGLAGVVAPRPLGAVIGAGAASGALYERGDIWFVYSLAALVGAAASAAPGGFLLLKSERRRAALSVDRVDGLAKRLRSDFSTSGVSKSGEPSLSIVEGSAPDGLMLIGAPALWRHPALAQGKAI